MHVLLPMCKLAVHTELKPTLKALMLLLQPKERSKPHPLSHGDTLTLGSTTFILHIHTGLDTCEGCDPVSLEQCHAESADSGSVVMKESLDVRRRRELSRIKAKYGLRVSHRIVMTACGCIIVFPGQVTRHLFSKSEFM